MDLKRIDFKEATGVYETHFAGEATGFYGESIAGVTLVGDTLWDEFADAEFLLGHKGDEVLGLAVYTPDASGENTAGLASVRLHTILTHAEAEQRATHFVQLLFNIRTRFQQERYEYFTAEAAPRDAFTVEMLEATEFKLIAPSALMSCDTEDVIPAFEVKAADSFEPFPDADLGVPGGDTYLGDIPGALALATLEREAANGNTYHVIRSGEKLGYICVVADAGATAQFGEPAGRLLHAHPWDAFALYDAARSVADYSAITTYASLTEPGLVQSLEGIGYRTVGAKLSFRLSLL